MFRNHSKNVDHSKRATTRAFQIAALYFVFGSMWIVISEWLVINEVGMYTPASAINLFKGMLYVVITACFLYGIVYNGFKNITVANQKLEKSETSLLDAQRLAHIGSYEYNPVTNLIECTDEALRIFGVNRNAFSGDLQETMDRIHPEDRQAIVDYHLQAHDNVTNIERLFRVIRPNGEERTVSVRRISVKDEHGVDKHIAGTVQDITERNHAENELRKVRDRAETYLNIAAVLFVILDCEGRVTLINRSGCETLGLDKSDILNADWIERFVPQEDRNNVRMLLCEVLSGHANGDRVVENRIMTSRGELRNIVWRNVPLREEDGRICGMLSAGMDITALKTTLFALHESERSKGMLLSNLLGMAFRCTQNRREPMLFVSEGGMALTGNAPDMLIGNGVKAYNNLICEEYRNALWRENEKQIAAHQALKMEYEIRTASGERKWVLETSQGVYDEQGKATAIEGIVIDIDESKMRFLQVQYMRDHDPLTGLYNRLYFENVKSRMDCEQNLPLCVIQADINGLMLMNEAFGFEFGDQMIIQAAKILQACCRDGDVLAKIGGDDFIILAPCTDHEKAKEMITSIKEACEQYNKAENDQMRILHLPIIYGIQETKDTSLSETIRQVEKSLALQKLMEKTSHHNAILASIMATLYERSFETEEHAKRIAALSCIMGERMNLSQRLIDELRLFAMLHDIGKIGISDQILKKPSKLTEEEWVEMRKHPEIGYRIVMSTTDLSSVGEYILTHHERWDGKGYPQGISGDKIPLLSRILVVADSYDAMTEDRVYHKGISKEEAIQQIILNTGTQFDPAIVEIFIDVMREAADFSPQASNAGV